MNDAQISMLAREVARDIRPLDQILKLFNLSAQDFEYLIEVPFFQTRLREETLLWNATDAPSIAERIKAKAGTLVEDCLLEVYALIHDPNQPMSAKVEALKWAARMAGVSDVA